MAENTSTLENKFEAFLHYPHSRHPGTQVLECAQRIHEMLGNVRALRGVARPAPVQPEQGEYSLLVVDDEEPVLEVLREFLEEEGFHCSTASSAFEALEILEGCQHDLLLTDIRMPGKNGLELLREGQDRWPEMAVIMVSAVSQVETAVHAMHKGAVDYVTKPFDLLELKLKVNRALQNRQKRLRQQHNIRMLEASAAESADALSSVLKSMEGFHEGALQTFAQILDAREHETQCHSVRVQAYAVRFGRQLGLTDSEMSDISVGALLHDIGKIGISDSILLKPGRLEEDEWAEIRRHPSIGYRIIKDVDLLRPAADIVLSHHERYDGRGYPQGLMGSEIPLAARLFSIVDTYDSITSDRPYRKASPHKAALAEIYRNAGTQFDTDLVNSFLELPREVFQEIRQQYE